MLKSPGETTAPGRDDRGKRKTDRTHSTAPSILNTDKEINLVCERLGNAEEYKKLITELIYLLFVNGSTSNV